MTITAFAITLTMISAVTMVYQHDPALVRYWIGHMEKIAPLVAGEHRVAPDGTPSMGVGVSPGNNAMVPNSASSGVGASSGSVTPGNAVATVNVQGTAMDVTPAEITQVNGLLSKYHILSTVEENLSLDVNQTVQIYLAQTDTDYKNKLATLGLSVADAARLSKDTGGFTQGDTILIPMSENKSQPDLVNTLGHELTHVILNQHITDIPSWANEGIAVYDGMQVQSQAETPVVYGGYARRITESVLQAASTGTLIPLTANESQVLQGNQSYDLELQDWLAVATLIRNNGMSAMHNYLGLLKDGVSSSQAFRNAFGLDETQFNTNLTQTFKQAAATGDTGVDLQFTIPASFHGYLRVLQHGTQKWKGFPAAPGTLGFTLTSIGTVVGPVGTVQSTFDSNPADPSTVYVNLDPSTPLTYKGQSVQDLGFAIDYHNGLYGFINNWITVASGKTFFSRTPTLFGVQLTEVAEHDNPSLVLPLIAPSFG